MSTHITMNGCYSNLGTVQPGPLHQTLTSSRGSPKELTERNTYLTDEQSEAEDTWTVTGNQLPWGWSGIQVGMTVAWSQCQNATSRHSPSHISLVETRNA